MSVIADSCLQTEAKRRNPAEKWIFEPWMDVLIMKAYRELQPVGRNHAVRDLAKRLRIPRWKVSRRARDIGAYEPRIKEKPWCGSELHILELNAMKGLEAIQRRLAASGFKRSVTGIHIKRQRLHLRQQYDPTSASWVARCFGVDIHAVLKWIERGWLNASRKGTRRTVQQGGDEWVILEKDIKRFIIDCIGSIDIRKVDKFWFVEILADRRGGLSIQDSCGKRDGSEFEEL